MRFTFLFCFNNVEQILQVYDNIERRQKEDLDVSQYALERSSAAFSTFSLILSVTYLAFALNLFLNHHVLLFDVAEEEKGAKRLSLMMRENVRRHGRTSSYVPPGSTNNEEFITRSSSSSDLWQRKVVYSWQLLRIRQCDTPCFWSTTRSSS